MEGWVNFSCLGQATGGFKTTLLLTCTVFQTPFNLDWNPEVSSQHVAQFLTDVDI